MQYDWKRKNTLISNCNWNKNLTVNGRNARRACHLFLKTDYKMLKNSFFTYNIMYDIIT